MWTPREETLSGRRKAQLCLGCEQIHYNEDRRVVVEPGSAEDLIDGRSHRAEAVRAQVAEGSGGEEGR